MKSTTEMDLSKINVGGINVANWPKLNNPFEEDKVNNPNHYRVSSDLKRLRSSVTLQVI